MPYLRCLVDYFKWTEQKTSLSCLGS